MRKEDAELRKSLLDTIMAMKNSIPKELVKKQLESRYPPDVIVRGITEAISDYVIDQFVDYAPGEGEFAHSELIWYLRILDKEDSQNLQALKPVATALLRLLYEQETPEHPGEMRVEDARAKLAEKGYAKSETKYLSVKDRVDTFCRLDTGRPEEWFRVIPEYKKSAEYKAAKEESDRELEDIIAFQMKILDIEEEEMDKRARVRAKKKQKAPSGQSL